MPYLYHMSSFLCVLNMQILSTYLFTFPVEVLSDKCPDGWTSVKPLPRVASLRQGDKKRLQCIKQFTATEKTSWYRAKAICVSHKSHLLEINSQHKSEEVRQHANSKYFQIPLIQGYYEITLG